MVFFGRRKRWQGQNWASWEYLESQDLDGGGRTGEKVVLNRGGTICFHGGILPSELRRDCLRSIRVGDIQFRQYDINQRPEPRIHVLLSPNKGEGYCYHGIHMRSQPISAVPPMESLHRFVGALYDLNFNIGVDVLIYRNGLDGCGWHSDNTQGERCVACVVLESEAPRIVKFRPKIAKGSTLQLGDEQLELWISQSDAYAFDALSQVGYEHCVPKRRNHKQRRICAILRAGIAKNVLCDSGHPILQCMLKATASDWQACGDHFPTRRVPLDGMFGHIKGINILQCYKRTELTSSRAHRLDRRGVAGCQTNGADALISSRTDSSQGEHDSFFWLTYTSSNSQGAGALFKSYSRRLPVRVFRSSSLRQNNQFAPPAFYNENNKPPSTAYRYDGLYWILGAYDESGILRDRNVDIRYCKGQIDRCHALTTFRLGRCCFQNGPQIPIRERSPEEIESEVRLAVSEMIGTLQEFTNLAECTETCGGDDVSIESRPTHHHSVNYSVELGRTLRVSPDTNPFKSQVLQPSNNKETWVQCDRCLKWRRIPDDEQNRMKISFSGLKSAAWECRMNPDRLRNSCAVDEENWDTSEDWNGDWRLSVEQEKKTRENEHERCHRVERTAMYSQVYEYLQFRSPMLNTNQRDCLPCTRDFRGKQAAATQKHCVSTKGHPIVKSSGSVTVLPPQTNGAKNRSAVVTDQRCSKMKNCDMTFTNAASTASPAMVPLVTVGDFDVNTDRREKTKLLDKQQPQQKRNRRFINHPFSKGDIVACKKCKQRQIGAVMCRAIRGHISDGWNPPPGFNSWKEKLLFGENKQSDTAAKVTCPVANISSKTIPPPKKISSCLFPSKWTPIDRLSIAAAERIVHLTPVKEEGHVRSCAQLQQSNSLTGDESLQDARNRRIAEAVKLPSGGCSSKKKKKKKTKETETSGRELHRQYAEALCLLGTEKS